MELTFDFVDCKW